MASLSVISPTEACHFYRQAIENVFTDMDHKITWIGFLSILSLSLPTRESGIRRDKYLSAALFKKAVHSDDP